MIARETNMNAKGFWAMTSTKRTWLADGRILAVLVAATVGIFAGCKDGSSGSGSEATGAATQTPVDDSDDIGEMGDDAGVADPAAPSGVEIPLGTYILPDPENEDQPSILIISKKDNDLAFDVCTGACDISLTGIIKTESTVLNGAAISIAHCHDSPDSAGFSAEDPLQDYVYTVDGDKLTIQRDGKGPVMSWTFKGPALTK